MGWNVSGIRLPPRDDEGVGNTVFPTDLNKGGVDETRFVRLEDGGRGALIEPTAVGERDNR